RRGRGLPLARGSRPALLRVRGQPVRDSFRCECPLAGSVARDDARRPRLDVPGLLRTRPPRAEVLVGLPPHSARVDGVIQHSRSLESQLPPDRPRTPGRVLRLVSDLLKPAGLSRAGAIRNVELGHPAVLSLSFDVILGPSTSNVILSEAKDRRSQQQSRFFVASLLRMTELGPRPS